MECMFFWQKGNVLYFVYVIFADETFSGFFKALSIQGSNERTRGYFDFHTTCETGMKNGGGA